MKDRSSASKILIGLFRQKVATMRWNLAYNSYDCRILRVLPFTAEDCIIAFLLIKAYFPLLPAQEFKKLTTCFWK